MKTATHRVQYIYRPHRRTGTGPQTGSLKPALRITGATLAAIGLTIGAAANVRVEDGRIIISAARPKPQPHSIAMKTAKIETPESLVGKSVMSLVKYSLYQRLTIKSTYRNSLGTPIFIMSNGAFLGRDEFKL